MIINKHNNIRCLVLPVDEKNPYQTELYSKLLHYKFQLEMLNHSMKAYFYAINPKNTINIVHVHWLHSSNKHSFLAATVRHFIFFLFLSILRFKGVKIVWTVHNILPHGCKHKKLETTIRILTGLLAETLIVHSKEAKKKICYEWHIRNKNKVHIVPHGNFIGSYENQILTQDARNRLNIPKESIVFLYMGRISAYKGTENVINSFKQVGDTQSVLLIAGSVSNPEYLGKLEKKVSLFQNILFYPGFVPEAEIQIYMNASNAAVFAHQENNLTSGSAILAMSFAKACLAPNSLAFTSILDEKGAFFFDLNSAQGLTEAFRNALIKKNHLSEMGRHNYEKAKSFDWSDIAKETATIYRNCLETEI